VEEFAHVRHSEQARGGDGRPDGLVVTDLGLRTTFEVFGTVVADIALVVASEARRTRPSRTQGWGGSKEPA
jgi:hypothetical protein